MLQEPEKFHGLLTLIIKMSSLCDFKYFITKGDFQMKITKIQNEFKVISTLTPEQIARLESANKNVIYEDRKPVYGVSFSESGATASFTGKATTFNEVSDSGKAMLTMTCCRKFNTDEEAIKDFIENNLEAINNFTEAELRFEDALANLDARVSEIQNSITTVRVD